MECSGEADFKTVPGFEFRATFEGDIEGFRLLQVLVAGFNNEVDLGMDTRN